METFSQEKRTLIDEIYRGGIAPTGALDGEAYVNGKQLNIILNDSTKESDEVVLFFWNYEDRKLLYVRNAELENGHLVWQEDATLRMQMKFMNVDSVRIAIAIKSRDQITCGYIRNKEAQRENLSSADRLIGKLFSKDKEALIAYWTEGGILSVKTRSESAFDNEYYRMTLSGAKWENDTFVGYLEMPLLSDEPQINMYSMTTDEPCDCGKIKITKEGFTGLKYVYRMTIELSKDVSQYEDGYYFACYLEGHQLTVYADEFVLENEKIHTIIENDTTFDVVAVREKNGLFVLQVADKIYPVMLSVVTAVYNTAPFLAEMINSVLQQQTDKIDKYIVGNPSSDYRNRKYQKIFEFILVDDGSTDGSAEILEDYARMSDSVRVIHKENGGVSSARNVGIEAARGKYITFPDSDDKLENNSFSECISFFEINSDKLAVVSCPMKFFDAQSGEHWANYKFTGENRIVDLNKEPNAVIFNVSSSYFKSIYFENRRFDTSLEIGEDMALASDIIMENPMIGLIARTAYLYRKRSGGNSAMDNNKYNEKTYLPVMRDVFEKILLSAKKENGLVPKYIQHTVMGQLQWRFATDDKGEAGKKTIGEKLFAEYKKTAYSLLKYIDNDVIMAQRKIWDEHRYFMFKQKYGCRPELISKNNDVYFDFKGTILNVSLGNIYIRIEFLDIQNHILHMEGYSMDLDCNTEFLIYVNGEKTLYQSIDRDVNKYTFDDICMYATTFSLDIPLDASCESYQIEFHSKLEELEVVKKQFRYQKTMPLSQSYSKSYYSKDGWTVRREGNKFYAYNMSYATAAEIDFEEEFQNQLSQSKNKLELKDISKLRKHALSILANHDRNRKIWLISDRITAANDNGEALFRYLNEIKDESVEAYYVIDENSKDFTRMKQFGNVVAYGSKQHNLLHLVADYIVSSGADEFVINLWHQNHVQEEALRDFLARKKFIFLQHGIIMNDISGWLNRYNKNIKGFVCAAPREAKSIMDYDYYYRKENVWLTGLPRHDRLYRDEKRYMTIMPTWRHWLFERGAEFEKSDYFIFYNELINNEKLLSAADKYDYTICFMPHPRVQSVINLFDRDPRVKFFGSEKPYNEIYAESNLVMTDYSSACMDFALLRKPIVYCQFDEKHFFEDHTVKHGYFSYEKDGFGEVVYDMDSLVDLMISYMESDCRVREIYGKRMDEFFAYHDKNNCQRVYEKIKELDEYDRRQ